MNTTSPPDQIQKVMLLCKDYLTTSKEISNPCEPSRFKHLENSRKKVLQLLSDFLDLRPFARIGYDLTPKEWEQAVTAINALQSTADSPYYCVNDCQTMIRVIGLNPDGTLIADGLHGGGWWRLVPIALDHLAKSTTPVHNYQDTYPQAFLPYKYREEVLSNG